MPIVWFYEDDRCGWAYLTLRLGMNHLKMDSTACSPCQTCALGHVRGLAATLVDSGVDFSTIPIAPLSFPELLKQLLLVGIFQHP